MKNLNFFLVLILMSLTAKADWSDIDYRRIEQNIREPHFAAKQYKITDFGAKPEATPEQNQKAINKAIATCSKKGGGSVIVPAGLFKTGAITLLSHVNLVVDENATLEFVFQPELYPIVPTRWEGLDCWNLQPCIYAYNATDVGVTGKGTIDGGGTNETWWKWCGAPRYGWKEGVISQRNGSRARLLDMAEDGVPMEERRFGPEDGLRPQLINFNQCDGILIENVTLLRSPFWVIHPLLSKNVIVRGVQINNDGPNGDGCDPESCDGVLIENCFFNTGDDCIAVKSGRNNDGRLWDRPSENIIIRNCVMKNGHGGVVIGSEISGGCRNLFAENCKMDSPNLERVIRIKTNTCRGGIVENINARNIEVGQCAESVLKINLDYERNEICNRGYLPIVRNVNLENITSQKSRYGVQIIALDSTVNVYDINIVDCHFNNVADGNFISGLTKDINYKDYYVNGSLCLNEKPFKHYSEWMTASEMKRQPKSYLLDFSNRPKWSYVMGIELESMLDTYLKHGNKEILDYCKLYTDTLIDNDGKIRGYNFKDYNLDNIRTGHFVTRMYELLPEEKNLKAMKTLMAQMEEQPRTKEGVYWHKAIYSYQVWLDGIFMGLPFASLTTPIIHDSKKNYQIWDDAVDQVKKTYYRTLDSETGLNRHAWDENRDMFWSDDETGLSKHCWGRAQGWFTMALIELLDAMPEDYQKRNEVISLLEKDLDSVIKWQDNNSGVWYQVMDSPGREGNYLESTASSMFTYALLKAYRKGYLGEKYRDAGIKAYRGILNNFIKVNQDSTISLTNCCSVAGLGPGLSPSVLEAAPKVKENKRRDGSFEYYLSEPIRDNDAKGIGPFIWASLEMESLGYDTNSSHKVIDRQNVVTRNNPKVKEFDPLSSLSVGNGHFAFTVDVTGLQSYPSSYKEGIPLNTMSDWGWHSFPNLENLSHEETLKSLNLHDRESLYAVEYKEDGTRQKRATEYYRVNPHRLNLGTIGLELLDSNGKVIPVESLTSINQELSLWDGKIESNFIADNNPVRVTTAVMGNKDMIVSRIKTPLLSKGKSHVTLRFSYPTGLHADDANDWTKPEKHSTRILSSDKNTAIIERELDGTKYYVLLQWEGDASLQEKDNHYFTLSTNDDLLSFSAEFTNEIPQKEEERFSFDQSHKALLRHWNSFWRTGGIADFSDCKDPRAKELERRVILSQYLTEINCNNTTPPQETGLTYNSWFGRPHLEMTWWHAVDFSLWNRPGMVRNMLDWYNNIAYPEAVKIAQRQGFKGVRWMKMTDPSAGEAPSNTGSFLIWQQPHYIYLAEEMYRHAPNKKTLELYEKGVNETAEFMADFAKAGIFKDGSIKLTGQTAMQESMSKDFSFFHPFEQAYWWYGLTTAQKWRERMGLERHGDWDDIINKLAPLHENEGTYSAGINILPFSDSEKTIDFDPFISPSTQGKKEISSIDFLQKSSSDHPAMLGACGLLPKSSLYKEETMVNTLNWVMNNWNWNTTWGWDYGMIAMAAARLGKPEIALEALLIDKGKNTYLINGHNFQEPNRLRLYLPGNGALLDAVAMMCAGWDGCSEVNNPGFPKDGNWNVRWENIRRMQ